MKIGDYVRTNKGTIDKLTEDNISMYKISLLYGGEKPIEWSESIIDLIEVGDYVNGMKVFEVMKNPEIDDIKEHLIVFVNEIKNELYTIYGNEIKSIVTKEQFEAMEYKL